MIRQKTPGVVMGFYFGKSKWACATFHYDEIYGKNDKV